MESFKDMKTKVRMFCHGICSKIGFTIYILYGNEPLFVHQSLDGNYERKVSIRHHSSGGNKLEDTLTIHLCNQITNATVLSKTKTFLQYFISEIYQKYTIVFKLVTPLEIN